MRAIQSMLIGVALSSSMACSGISNTLTHQMTGAKSTLDSVKGQVVVINFWADWCGPCITELPLMATLVSEAGPGVAFFAAYYEDEPWQRQFYGWYEKQPEWFRQKVYWSTRDLRNEYLKGSIPVTIVLGRDGKLVEQFTGSIKHRASEFRAALQRGLSTKVAEPAARSER